MTMVLGLGLQLFGCSSIAESTTSESSETSISQTTEESVETTTSVETSSSESESDQPVAGWGPERETFTMDNPADYITFNSITDNVAVGDERNFVRIREANTNNKYRDSVSVVPGLEYEVYIYFHNDGKSSLNGTGNGVATDVRVFSGLTSWKVNRDNRAVVSATITASNSNPEKIWDGAYITTDYDNDVILRYVEDSAVIHNGWDASGTLLSEDIFMDDGVLIGENQLDGTIPACAEFSGYVTYRIRAEQIASRIDVDVCREGGNYNYSAKANPGDVLTYKAVFMNTGSENLSDVTFHAVFPEGLSLVPGTTVLVNGANPDGLLMKDIVDQNGFNTGLYGPKAKAELTFQVKVDENVDPSELSITVYSDYSVTASPDQYGEVYDSASVVVSSN